MKDAPPVTSVLRLRHCMSLSPVVCLRRHGSRFRDHVGAEHEHVHAGPQEAVEGLGRLVRSTCDVVASIPIRAETESLNAGVATGISLYEVARLRTQA